jgi:hydrogenase nickel incorporation protein HypB
MCVTCGCGDAAGPRVTAAHPHEHPHEHPHGHDHPDGRPYGSPPEIITLEQKVLAKNDRLAGRNRDLLGARGILAVNMMSSPGAGKTTLLERTIHDTAGRRPVAVIEGDQETLLDADRIRRTGCAVVQVNTGAGCHLDAAMVHDALTALDPAPGSVLFVENVGNLVCPALFDLGEHGKVVIISVTEGTDKPLKYPHMFAVADLIIINKIDLLPYVDFDLDLCRTYAHAVNPHAEVLPLSATTGDNVGSWYDWLAARAVPVL